MTGEGIDSLWLVSSREKPNGKVRLFSFPFAGGSAATYRLWQDDLPESIGSSPVELPGRGRRLSEPPFHHLTEIVDALAQALSPFFDKPFAFFGHSMGALISFELCRRLRRDGNVFPVHLFVSGRRAPHLPKLEPASYNLPEPEFIERLRCLNGTSRAVLDHPELMQLMIPLLRADFSVSDRYEYKTEPPLDCPVTVFGGIGDVETTREQLEQWHEHTTSVFSLHMFPGDHFFLHSAQPEMLSIIARQLRSATE